MTRVIAAGRARQAPVGDPPADAQVHHGMVPVHLPSPSVRPRLAPLLRTVGQAALGVGVLAACGDPTAATDLFAARRRWSTAEPPAYRFTLQLGCFCGSEATRPVVVAVRAGRVQSRTYLDTGAPVDARLEEAFPTIEGLFAVIDDALERDADHVAAEYSARRGYPTRISIDYESGTADDELTYTVRDLGAQ